MADGELNLEDEQTNKVEKRIKDLSSKVETTSQERDEFAELNKQKDEQLAQKDKEIGFLGSFGDVLSKFPQAAEHRDKIKEKFMSGYSTEDAVVAVLNAEGKLTAGTTPAPKAGDIAGGSAVNQPNLGDKSLEEMSRDEKRAALEEAVARGDISIS